MTDQPRATGRASPGPIALTAIVAAAIVAAAIVAGAVVLATSGSSSREPAASKTTPTPRTTPSTGATVQAASLAELRALPASLGHPVYWAGPMSGATYELTRTQNGRVYIRYLTGGAKVGSTSRDFLAVGTYVLPNGEALLRAVAALPGSVSLPFKGGVALYRRARPTSVYFVLDGGDVQVETYDPSPAVARKLVETGAIKPVG